LDIEELQNRLVFCFEGSEAEGIQGRSKTHNFVLLKVWLSRVAGQSL